MKNWKKVFMFVFVFTLMTSSAFADAVMEVEPNDTIEDARKQNGFSYYSNSVTVDIYGVVNSEDTVDYIKIKPLKTGPATIYMHVPDNASAKLHLYNSNGNLITTSITVSHGELEDIRDIYMRDGNIYYLKVEYVSGNIWNRPYRITWYIGD